MAINPSKFDAAQLVVYLVLLPLHVRCRARNSAPDVLFRLFSRSAYL